MGRADRVFALVLVLALGSSAILLALLATLLTRLEALARRGPADGADAVAVLLLGLASCGIALGLGTLARQLLATLRLIRSLMRRRVAEPARVAALGRELGLAGRLDVVEDARPFSFCYWFARPRICLSTGLLARLRRDELRAVLLHERYHLRHRDPLRLVIARYFAAGLYVVPVVDELVDHFVLEKELEADEDAVRALGDVAPLARALDALLPDADAVTLGLLVPVGSLSVTEARIEWLIDRRPRPLVLRPASAALSAGALLGAAVLSWAPAAVQALPALASVPGLVVAPASLLLAAAVAGGARQLRLVAQG